MVKRTSENQLTKDDYEQLDEAKGDEPVRGVFERASEETLRSRRRFVASRPTQVAPPPSAGSMRSNPFAKVNLTSKAAMPPSSFGSQKTTAAPTGGALQPKFGGFVNTSDVPAAPTAAPFSFGSSTSTTSTPHRAAPVAGENVDSTDWNEQSALLNKAYQSCVKSSSVFQDLAKEAIQYVRYCGHQMNAYVQQVDSNNTSTESAPAAPTLVAPAPAAPVPTAPAPAAFGNFATAPQPTPQPPFSFASTNSGTNKEKSSEEDAKEKDDGDEDSPAIQQGKGDPDWDTLAEVGPVKIYHLNDPKKADSGYTEFARGKLLLQRHKTNDSKRMLMRHESGIAVLVNMKVDPGMKFTKTTTKRKGQTRMDVAFTGTNDVERGYESFRILSRADVGERLYSKLTELSV